MRAGSLPQRFGTCLPTHVSSLLQQQRQTALKPPWLLPRAVLETGAHGSCRLPAACRLLLHPTLPSPGLSDYECGLPGHERVCVYAITHLFVYAREKTTKKPVLANTAPAGFGEKLCAFICLRTKSYQWG